MTYYLDTSAVVKLVKREPETTALAGFSRNASKQGSERALVSSDLLRTELMAAVLRAGMEPQAAIRATNALYVLRLSPQMCESAGMLAGGLGIRSVDALHRAAAVSVRESLAGVITYDLHMAEAATRLGFPVGSPS